MKREEERKQLKNLKERYRKQNEYLKDKYDRVSAVLPKGTKERLQAISDKAGIKASAFITKAVLDAIEREEKTAAGTLEDVDTISGTISGNICGMTEEQKSGDSPGIISGT